ncbi:MAG: hypothetical protein AAF532_08455 [Planctomycetota bacterium]
MTSVRRSPAFVLALFGACFATVTAARAQPSDGDPPAAAEAAEAEQPLPQIDKLPLPSAAALLAGPPRDRVVLNTGEVLIVEPLAPRPGTLAAIEAEYERVRRDPAGQGKPSTLRKLEELEHLVISLPDDPVVAAYRLRRELVLRIEYHEDLMLRRIDRLLADGDTATAFEMIDALLRDAPAWPGLSDRRASHLEVEAVAFLERDRPFDALRRAAEYRRLRRDLGLGLPRAVRDVADAAAARVVDAHLDGSDAVTAAAELRRIADSWPDLPSVTTRRAAIDAIVADLVAAAADARNRGRLAAAAAAIETAARIAPRHPEVGRPFRRITAAYPRLHVAVIGPGDAVATATDPSPRDRRLRRLTRADLFVPVAFGKHAMYAGSLLRAWRPTDLGRRTRLVFREPLAREAAARLDRLAARGGETRFGHLFAGSRAFDAARLEVVATRPLAASEAILSAALPSLTDGPFRPAEDRYGFEPRVAAVVAACRGAVASRRFVRRDDASRPGLLAEIVEHDFPDAAAAQRAFDVGAVDAVVGLPPWDAGRHDGDRSVRLEISDLPDVTCLFIDPASERLGGIGRRALAYAVDVAAVIAEDVLREDAIAGPAADLPAAARPTAAVAAWATTHRGIDPRVSPRQTDLALAATLRAIAANRGEARGPIRFSFPSTPSTAGAASRLTAAWRRAGFEIEPVGQNDPWDVALRVVRAPDPGVSLAGWLTGTDDPAVADLLEWPVSVREPLLAIERATTTEQADAELARLHRALDAEAFVIPLFEARPLRLFRTAVTTGFAGRSDFYVGAEDWTLRRVLPKAP